MKNKESLTTNNSNKVNNRKLYAKTNSTKGAKSKLETHSKEIIQRTLEGASVKDRIGGLIHPDTYNEWFNAGQKDIKDGIISQYSEFSSSIKDAEVKYRDLLRSYIKLHATNDWKAASWLLERSDPETYKLRDKVDIDQKVEVSQKAILEIPDNGKRKIACQKEKPIDLSQGHNSISLPIQQK